MPDDLDAFLTSAQRAADAAGDCLRRHFRAGVPTEVKSDLSPVTLADRAAEQAMRVLLSGAHPTHAILGEEGGEQLGDSGPTKRYRWAIDPIDGTRAFITGRPLFGTLIALLDHGAPILGIIDQPISGERWIGCTGRPTRFTGAYGRVGTRAPPRLGACELSCTSPQMFNPWQAERWHSLAAQTARATYGGDCYAYGLLALGQIDIVAEASMKLWDWAALAPIVHGAGGCLTDWSGRPLSPDGDGTVLALGNPALLPAAVQALAA